MKLDQGLGEWGGKRWLGSLASGTGKFMMAATLAADAGPVYCGLGNNVEKTACKNAKYSEL
jgi:hypothetical protein